ncbi:hypothetical protein MTR_3g110500 [Medicago truncatula]|uniref:RNase H type-1 domain-containing protein n=1 Tax=Medicago truncatula TaxID=3880 RepID=G7J3J3_MEDTR|nr:hypothetical protein MTR_3g110500 [Medicago truncatula]
MRSIEVAHQKHWLNFWWFNCKKLLQDMNFVISHIYREGNQCESAPVAIVSQIVKDKLGMPSFRFVPF